MLDSRERRVIHTGGTYARYLTCVEEVPLEPGSGTLRAGRPQLVIGASLFFFDNGPTNHYAVAADGQSFVMLQEQDASANHDHVKIILGWQDALRAITDGS